MSFSLDNTSNKQEDLKVVDTSEIVESLEDKQARLEAKFGNPEDVVGKAERGPETSTNFEGSKIFTFNKDGIPIRYALRRNEQGNLEGNSFLLQAKGMSGGSGENWTNTRNGINNIDANNPNSVDHRIAWTQQMSKAELSAVERILGDRI